MYTLMGGGLLCAVSGLVLLIVATATDFWMQYRYSENLSNQGLWRFCVSGKCHPHTVSIGEQRPGLPPSGDRDQEGEGCRDKRSGSGPREMAWMGPNGL
ncbi:2-oxoglutarate dehydrogenase-like, mitochondrial [Platysternon megacephalum]|uniref:2-oxoglutarate dehydrogenase-like, mitochondrial n=1 Tax=Platysternon megacephalum TaxID=55544 RepID=A0A4D9E8F5_9SAUR|nr:2-oxoglutarate dehydrogenase-like, mitochondrial [Platysternon megacephalum]